MTAFIMTGRCLPEAIEASISLNKVLGITCAAVPALGVEEFDELIVAKG